MTGDTQQPDSGSRGALTTVLSALTLTALTLLLLRPHEAETPALEPSSPASVRDSDPQRSTLDPLVTELPVVRSRHQEHWLTATASEQSQKSEVERGTLSGRVLWRHSGKALEGARVGLTTRNLETVIPTRLPTDDKQPFLLAEAETNLRGEFTLQNVPDRKQLVLFIEHSGHFRDIRKVPFVPMPGEELYFGDIHVEERGTATGIALDENGWPLAAVRIRGVDDPFHRDSPLKESLAYARSARAEHFNLAGTWMGGRMGTALARRDALLPFPETRTGSDGSFVLPGLRPGKLQLLMQKEGYPDRRVSILVNAGRNTELGPLRFDAGDPIEITVEDERGQAREGILVSVSPAGWGIGPEPIATDEDGRAEFRLPGRRQYLRELQDFFGYMPDREQSTWYPQRREVDILVQQSREHPWQVFAGSTPMATIILREPEHDFISVVTQDGLPIPEAELSFSSNVPRKTTTELRPGLYRVDGLLQQVSRSESGGPALLVIKAEGFAPAVARLPLPREVIMLPAGSVPILVTDSMGRPVHDARVRVQMIRQKESQHPGRSWHLLDPDPRSLGRSSEAGVLLAEGIWDAKMRFLAEHPSGGSGEVTLERPLSGGQIEITLRKHGGIRGFLTRNGRQAPFRRWRVLAERIYASESVESESAEAESTAHTVTLADGSFSFPSLPEGAWSMRILEPEVPLTFPAGIPSERPSHRLHVIANRIVYFSLDLSKYDLVAPELRGHLTMNGQPAAGLRVFTLSEPPNRRIDRHRKKRPANTQNAEDPTRSSQSDSSGYFEILSTDDRDGSLGLVVQRRHAGKWVTIDIREIATALHDPAHPICIDLSSGALRLELFDRIGFPVRSQMFRLLPLAAESYGLKLGAISVVSDRLGYIEIGELPVGEYQLEALGEDPSLPSFDETFSVVQGLTLTRRVLARVGSAPAAIKRDPQASGDGR